MSIVKEFKKFAVRGNVMDMAVGVVIGGAFGKIVTSLVNDILMPPIGLMTSGIDYADKVITLKAAVTNAAGEVVTPAVKVSYGVFVNNVINFVIVAFAMFAVVKIMNSLKDKEDVAPTAPPPKQEVLLTEIRDLLKARG